MGRFGGYKLILFSVVLHLYCVNGMNSNNSMSGNSMSGNSMSGNSMSGNSMSGNSMSGNSMPGNSMSGNSNKNTPAMPHMTTSNDTGMAHAVQLGEKAFLEVISMCNASYQIPISYMEEMNATGSYPDETEKIPMCFMKCYLENMGAISTDNTIEMQQATLLFTTSEDIVTSCFKELSEIDTLDQCEYAYFLARCIMMGTLVDNRKSAET